MIIIDRVNGKNGETSVGSLVWIVSGLLKLEIWEYRHSHGLKPQNV